MSKCSIPGNGLKSLTALVYFHHGAQRASWCIHARVWL